MKSNVKRLSCGTIKPIIRPLGQPNNVVAPVKDKTFFYDGKAYKIHYIKCRTLENPSEISVYARPLSTGIVSVPINVTI